MAAAYDRFVLRAGGQAVVWRTPARNNQKVNMFAKVKVMKVWEGRQVEYDNGNVDYEYRIKMEYRDGTGVYVQVFRFGQIRKEFQRSRFTRKAWALLPELAVLDNKVFTQVHAMFMERSFKEFDAKLKHVTDLMVYGRPVYTEIPPYHGHACLTD
jgi:hypothetical protein